MMEILERCGIHASNLLLASWAIGIGVALVLFRVVFPGFRDFLECLRFWFTPELISALRGEWHEDRWAAVKLWLWLGLSALAGMSAYYCLPVEFPGIPWQP